MGGKRRIRQAGKPARPQRPDQAQKALWLAPLAACLAAGAGLGSFYFAKWGGGMDLTAYLGRMAYAGRLRIFVSLLFRQLLYLVPLFLCGCLRRGFGAAALLFGIKGFFTARLAVGFLLSHGARGYAALIAACFLQSFCSILCMLLLGCHTMALCAGRRAMPKSRRRLWCPVPPAGGYQAAGVACLLLCLACCLAVCLLAPPLSRAGLALLR